MSWATVALSYTLPGTSRGGVGREGCGRPREPRAGRLLPFFLPVYKVLT